MLTIRIVKAKPWPRTFVGDKWGDWDLSLRFPVRIHFRLSHWSVHMIWNGIQFADGVSIPEIVSFQDEGPWLHRIVPDVVAAPDVIHAVPTLPAGKAAIREETASGLKIRCDKQGGILEIVDPRMFRPASETFCRGLSATAISLGGASGVDLDLPTRSCRFHFEPDRFDEAELARRVSLAIEAATMAVQLEASGFVDGRINSALQEPAITSGREELPVTTSSDRCRCMALGGGSLMVGVAGLILPGIPLAPFLLFSAHYFMQSSTTFQRWLDGIPKLGEIVRKLEASGGMVLDRSSLMKTLGMGILLGLMFLVIHPPLLLVMAIELGLTVFFSLREIGDLGPLSREVSEVFA